MCRYAFTYYPVVEVQNTDVCIHVHCCLARRVGSVGLWTCNLLLCCGLGIREGLDYSSNSAGCGTAGCWVVSLYNTICPAKQVAFNIDIPQTARTGGVASPAPH